MRVVSPSCTPVGSAWGYPRERAVSVGFRTVSRPFTASSPGRTAQEESARPALRVRARRVATDGFAPGKA